MTPKNKAEALYLKMLKWQDDSQIYLQREISCISAKQCALIAVDEILKLMIKEFKWDINHNGNIDYWEEVKQEINNL